MADSEIKTFGIIQLTRIGDVLQTYQTCELFKKSYPDVRLVLIARKQFASGLDFLLDKVFDEVILLDFKEIYNSSKTFSEIQAGLNQHIEKINSFNIDVLINLSFSKTSSYLSSVIETKHRLGSRYTETNEVIVSDQWSQFIYANVMGGPNNPFNLVDAFRNIFGFEVNENDIQAIEVKTDKPVISIHPFASQDKKQWKSSKWVEVIFKLLKTHPEASLNLLGSPGEVEKANEILSDALLKNYQDQITNYVGKTNFKELYTVLQDSTHFIGHDSMTGHLAKIARIPTLTISLGTVRPIETTPYGLKSFNIVPRTKCYPCFPDDKCDFFQCHADVSYQAVAGVIDQFVKKGEINYETLSKDVSNFHLDPVDIFESYFTNKGYFSLAGINPRFASPKEIVGNLLRSAWLFKFNELEEIQDYPSLNEKSYNELYELLKGVQHLFELCEFGKKYSKYILLEVAGDSPSVSKIKEYSKKIDEIDQLQELILKTHPLLTPVIRYYKVVKGNLVGENIIELSESSHTVYHDCGLVCSILFELIEKTLAEHKIKNKKFVEANK